jgi:hypothetical protein
LIKSANLSNVLLMTSWKNKNTIHDQYALKVFCFFYCP